MVRLASAQRPLAADFAAPLAYYPEPGLRLGMMALMRPQNYEQRAGLYMLEPYDPDRIPVIFVHGLISVPQMWVPTIAAVESDLVLHGRCQFWAFASPTGDPILMSALKLRESLQEVFKLYPKTKDMVLISYSMRGLLAQMQAATTGRVLWDDVFKGDADRLYVAVPPDNLMKRALIFEANPRVRRIVSFVSRIAAPMRRSTGLVRLASVSFACRGASWRETPTEPWLRSKRMLALSTRQPALTGFPRGPPSFAGSMD